MYTGETITKYGITFKVIECNSENKAINETGSNLYFKGDAKVSSLRANNVLVEDSLEVSESLKVESKLEVGDWLEVGSSLKVVDSVKVGSSLKVGDWLEVGSSLKVGDWLDVGSSLDVGESLKVGDWLKVGSWLRFGSWMDIGSWLDVERFKLKSFCKWDVSITSNFNIVIGCKEKSIEDWDSFFEKEESHETNTKTDDYKLIKLTYDYAKSCLSVISFLTQKER